MSPFLQYVIGVAFFAIVEMLQIELIQRKYAKKCGYDCSVCKNWKCFSHYCAEKRKE